MKARILKADNIDKATEKRKLEHKATVIQPHPTSGMEEREEKKQRKEGNEERRERKGKINKKGGKGKGKKTRKVRKGKEETEAKETVERGYFCYIGRMGRNSRYQEKHIKVRRKYMKVCQKISVTLISYRGAW